ncbi:MAG: ABC transporter ATP-binding protein [Acidimicrobiia bacterium]
MAVRDVSVAFGGLSALSNVSLSIEEKSIHALIGPNGAGKSTLLNVLSGVYTPTAGSVTYRGNEITRLRPHDIARLGFARTFQNLALFHALSVEDNLMVGRHSATRAGFLAAGIRARSALAEDSINRERTREVAGFVGLNPILQEPVGNLPYGTQKRVEIARALCMEPSVLLLDEPVAGMTGGEVAQMADLIISTRGSLGVTVFIVEHHMGLVMAISDQVSVLDFGTLIAEGPPQHIREDPRVIRAYLGDSAGRQLVDDGTPL